MPGLWAALLPALAPLELLWPHSSSSSSISPQLASLVSAGAVTWLRCPECLSGLHDPLLSPLPPRPWSWQDDAPRRCPAMGQPGCAAPQHSPRPLSLTPCMAVGPSVFSKQGDETVKAGMEEPECAFRHRGKEA